MTAPSENKKKQGILSPEKFIRTKVRLLPLGKCYINESWYDMGKGSLIISRKHSNGNITCGFYLVDLFCIGMKDSFYLYNISGNEFENVLDEMSEKEDLLEIEYSLAHNIIYGSLNFAGTYNFKPHKSFQLTKYILEDAKKEIEYIDVPFGIDSKPAVVVSEQDSKVSIINHLKKTLNDSEFLILDETEFENLDHINNELTENFDAEHETELNEHDMEEYGDDSLLGDYESYSEEELFNEVETLGEDDAAEAIGPIHELFLRLQDADRFESLYIKNSQVFEEIIIVNDFNYPGLNYLPEEELERFYELSMLTEKSPADAVLAISDALDRMPHPVYEHLMVSAYGYMGLHDEATSLLKKAVEKYSNDFMLRVGYGFILLMDEQYDALKMFMSGFDLKKVAPDRNMFHIMEIGRYLCLVCSYYALTNQLLLATVYQKILDDFTEVPEGTYYQKLTTFKILTPMQWEYILENYPKKK